MAVCLRGYRKLMVFERPSQPPTPPAIEKADLTTAEIEFRSVLKPVPVDIGTNVLCLVLIDANASVGQVRQTENGLRIRR